jgi:hypothetical protein
MISSGAALKTSTGASWDDLVAAWDSGTVTWNDVFASVTLSGTCTARSGNVSDSITVTKRVTGIATARAASSGTLTVFRLFGVCTARAVNTGVVRATKRLVGTDTVRGINAGDIDS